MRFFLTAFVLVEQTTMLSFQAGLHTTEPKLHLQLQNIHRRIDVSNRQTYIQKLAEHAKRC